MTQLRSKTGGSTLLSMYTRGAFLYQDELYCAFDAQTRHKRGAIDVVHCNTGALVTMRATPRSTRWRP